MSLTLSPEGLGATGALWLGRAAGTVCSTVPGAPAMAGSQGVLLPTSPLLPSWLRRVAPPTVAATSSEGGACRFVSVSIASSRQQHECSPHHGEMLLQSSELHSIRM